jgi:hypothetical protein
MMMALGRMAVRGVTMPMLGRRKLLPHQRPATVVAHDLTVRHAVAPADRCSRHMGRGTMRMLRSMLSMSCAMRLMRALVPRRACMMAGPR